MAPLRTYNTRRRRERVRALTHDGGGGGGDDDEKTLTVEDLQVAVVGFYPQANVMPPLIWLYAVAALWLLAWLIVLLWAGLSLSSSVNVWVLFFVSLGGDGVLFLAVQFPLVFLYTREIMVTESTPERPIASYIDSYVTPTHRSTLLLTVANSVLLAAVRNGLIFVWLLRFALDTCCDVRPPSSGDDARFLFYLLFLLAAVVTAFLLQSVFRGILVLRTPEYVFNIPVHARHAALAEVIAISEGRIPRED